MREVLVAAGTIHASGFLLRVKDKKKVFIFYMQYKNRSSHPETLSLVLFIYLFFLDLETLRNLALPSHITHWQSIAIKLIFSIVDKSLSSVEVSVCVGGGLRG